MLEKGFCSDLSISMFFLNPPLTCYLQIDEQCLIDYFIFCRFLYCNFLNLSKVNVDYYWSEAPELKLTILRSYKLLTFYLKFKITDRRLSFRKNNFSFSIIEYVYLFSLRIVLFHIFNVFHFLNCLKKFRDFILSNVFLYYSQLFRPWKSLGLF